MSEEFGPIQEVTIEIGNEFYQSRFDWSTEQFAMVQAQIASWIHEEALAIEERENIDILAQTGRTSAENELFASFFSEEGAATIDGVLTHLYGTNSSGDPLNIGGGIANRLDDINLAWSQVLPDDFILAVTEWNVGESGPETTLINGQMRIAPLLRIYTEMLQGGVDTATIWSTITNGPAGLAQVISDTPRLSTTGYLYSMLLNNTSGLALVETEEGNTILDQFGEEIGYSYVFGNQTRYVIYISSASDEAINFVANISDLNAADSYIYASSLSAVDGTNGTEYWARSQLEFTTNLEIIEDGDGQRSLDIVLDPYQLIEVHVVFDGGILISGDVQNAIDDELTGSNSDDTLSGNLGDDWIDGSGGSDYLSGGEGCDTLLGGNDNDTILGGLGDDYLYGENGRDLLDGGDGNDYLDGGFSNDTLVAGSGQDTLIGGAGNDLFLVGLGDATVDGGVGTDTLSFQDATTGVSVFTSFQTAEVGESAINFSSIEVFEGSAHSDYFEISLDETTFRGGDGADGFMILDGSLNSVHGDDGDDYFFVYSPGSNQIIAGYGNDEIRLFFGENTISLGPGNDVVRSFNPMADVFLFTEGDGRDEIFGFDVERDRIAFTFENVENVTTSETSFGTEVHYGERDSFFLHGIFGLSADDNIFL
jgi:Ca2+-binding RTX toxin-like protein